MSPRPRIAVIAGDGIGPEVTRFGVELLEFYRDERGVPLELWSLDLSAERWLREGVGLPRQTADEIRDTCTAVLLGALGDPRIPGHEHAREIVLGLRFGLDLYANIRPTAALADRLVPLGGRRKEDVDMVVFRENTEGLYSGVGGQLRRGTSAEVAIEEDVNTRLGVERIVRAAFAYARSTQRRLCLADKSNVLRHGHDLWQRVYQLVRSEYADVPSEHLYIDALCYELVRDPARFSVIVSCNLFGDILSDLTAALSGGLGLAPSASLHPGGNVPGLFEPVHGSAPALAGQGVANPIAMLRTVGLLLENLQVPDARRHIDQACAAALQAHECTPDVGGSLDSAAAAQAVFRRLAAAS
ncbi:MAG TPA: isocitrate/isopropylmalate family dehydrogenase [Polyangiaceae bacterium]|nr:isocitrate/isopropylmalate family dehydrogenase [Polyangiaceae bacterium]